MDQKEALRGMLQDVINDKMENAAVSMHNYFITKTREVAGFGSNNLVNQRQHRDDDTDTTGTE